jgi:hypothetical protein
VAIRWRLFLASVLMLFLELSLIRWLGANVVHLSYLSDFVILGSFLGIGLASVARRGLSCLSCFGYHALLILAAVRYVGAYLVSPASAQRLQRPSNAL